MAHTHHAMTMDPRLEAEAPAIRVLPTFEAFYRETYASTVALAYALSGSRAAAEDLAQEAFIAAFGQWPRVSGLERPGAWVRRVVANRSVSLFRRRMSEGRALLRVAMRRAELIPEMAVENERFWQMVRSLPRRQAQTLALHYVLDLPIAEIGEILGCAAGTVKAHLHQGRKALAIKLGEEEA